MQDDSQRFGPFEIQAAKRQLLHHGTPVALGARAFDALWVLFERHDCLVTKAELIERVWPGLVVEDNNLHQQISTLRRLLGPATIATVAGRGYRLVTPAQAAGDRGDAVGPTVPAAAQDLPRPRGRFVGRDAALQDCQRLLQHTGLLTLTGIGGCGKTGLALQLAQRERGNFAHGVCWVDLAPVQDGSRVAAALMARLALRDEGPDNTQLSRLQASLATCQQLIVLDNCEHVLSGASALIEALLSGCPQLRVLATSREALNLAGEQRYPVPSLLLPGSDALIDVLGAEAVRVFHDRAREVLPSFEITAANAAAVADICRRLDGIALAVELAAVWVKLLSVDDIRARLDQRFALLTGGRSALPRHQTLHAALAWSIESLQPAEQQLLRQLAVFPAGCALAGAQAVSDVTGDYALLAMLTQLHDKSLLLVDSSGQGGDATPRYRMLETVRQFALASPHPTDEQDRTRTRHLQHLLALAEAAAPELTGPQQSQWMSRLRVEQENLLAALQWCAQRPDGAAPGLRLAAATWRYWLASGQLALGHGVLKAAMTQAGEPGTGSDRKARCQALLGLGQIVFRMGRYPESQGHAEQALQLARASGDARLVATSLGVLATSLSALDQAPLALAHYEAARDMLRNAGEPFQLATVLNNLAEVHRDRGQLPAAQACYEEALAISRDLHNAGITVVVACNLARLHIAAGENEQARRRLLECLALAPAAGLKGMAEDWLEVGASLAVALQDFAQAALLHGASLARMAQAGARREPVDEAAITPLMARARQALGAAAFEAREAAGRGQGYADSLAALQQWLEGSAPSPTAS